MRHTNRLRVVLGGLLAGVVINVVEYVTNGVVLRDSWAQTMQALGRPATVSTGAIVTFNVWGFLLGIAAVWIYAAIRVAHSAPCWRPRQASSTPVTRSSAIRSTASGARRRSIPSR